jgi:LAO/AO transport system kinase
MEKLSRHPSAYIRPSPSGGALGGVTRKTRETITLCEAAGYDVILVETVGVGQSEVAVRSMTDFFLLLALTGAGDELQGIKKGIVEMADGIVVTKADGDNVTAAEKLRLELAQVLHFLMPATPGWKPEVCKCSSVERTGIREVWEMIEKFHTDMTASGEWAARRMNQAREGLADFAREQVLVAMSANAAVREDLIGLSESVVAGKTTLRDAASLISARFLRTNG